MSYILRNVNSKFERKAILPPVSVTRYSSTVFLKSDVDFFFQTRIDVNADFPEICYYNIESAFLTPQFCVFTEDNIPVLDTSIRLSVQGKTKKLSETLETYNSSRNSASSNKNHCVPGQVILAASFGGLKVWGHWLVQNLVRVLYAKSIFKNLKIAIPRSFKGTSYYQSLLYYGVVESDIVFLSRDRNYVFENLLMLDYLYRGHSIHPVAVDILKGYSVKDSNKVLHDYPKRVLVKRLGSRKIKNFSQVEMLLQKFGFLTISFDNIPFSKQVDLWKNAEVIISPTGSDLTNIVFSNDSLKVGMLTPSYFKDIFFIDLASAFSVKTYEIVCNTSFDKIASIHDDFEVDLESVQDMIAQMNL